MGGPFIYQRALMPGESIVRRQAVKRVLSSLANSNSIAIIALPLAGKSSLLHFFNDINSLQAVYGNVFDKTLFRYMNKKTLAHVAKPADFWLQALLPFTPEVTTSSTANLRANGHPVTPERSHIVTELYQQAQRNHFERLALEHLFEAMHGVGQNLVLLIDDFDELIQIPGLQTAAFYAQLRSLATRYRSLSLVVTSCQNLTDLNRLTQQLHSSGSPPFNFLTEYYLASLSDRGISTLLAKGGTLFSDQDKRLIRELSGDHPYLAQVAAGMLWQAHQQGVEGEARYLMTCQTFNEIVTPYYERIWQMWSEPKQLIILLVTLMMTSVGETNSIMEQLLADLLARYKSDLTYLSHSKMVVHNSPTPSGWAVTQLAFLFWLIAEWQRDDGLMDWFKRGTVYSLLNYSQRQQLQWVMERIIQMADGEQSWVETYARQIANQVLPYDFANGPMFI